MRWFQFSQRVAGGAPKEAPVESVSNLLGHEKHKNSQKVLSLMRSSLRSFVLFVALSSRPVQ